MDNAARGRLGEHLALLFFRACGFTCRDRRWRRGGGEIDLVLERTGLVVFVEVKLRGPGSLGSAVESVSPAQMQRLRRLARLWCHENAPVSGDRRLDVVTVDLAGENRGLILRHYPGAG